MRVARFRILAVMMVLLVLAAACGDDAVETTTTAVTTTAANTTAATTTTAAPTTTEATTTTAAPASIKIMTMGAFSGFIANPEIAPAVGAAVAAINLDGGINGAMVEQLVCDTEGDANKEATCAQQAVDEGVAAVVGAIFLSGADAYAILEAASIPVIGVVANTQSDFISPVAFPVTGSIVGSAAILASALAEAGSTHLAAVYVDLPAAAAVPAFANAGLARFNLTIGATVPVPYGAADMATYVAAATAGETDGVVVFLSGQDALNFVTALKQADPAMPVAMMMSQMEETLAALGDSAEGLIFPSSAPLNMDDPVVQKFYADMEAAGATDTAGNAAASYAAMLIFAQVAATLDAVTAPAMLAALPTAGVIETGLLGPLDFSQGGILQLPRLFQACTAASHIEDGQVVAGPRVNYLTGADC